MDTIYALVQDFCRLNGLIIPVCETNWYAAKALVTDKFDLKTFSAKIKFADEAKNAIE
jgi:hypothetical protein